MAATANGFSSAGIFAGPTAWMASTQANYAIVPWECAHQIGGVPILALGLAAVSVAGGLVSWHAFRVSDAAPHKDPSSGGRPRRFLAAVGMGIAALFALVILVQGAAGLVLHGCER